MAQKPQNKLQPTQQDFRERFAPGFLELVLSTLAEKGVEYSKKGAFDNFERVSQMMGISREEYLMTVASKHWLALIEWVRGNSSLGCTSANERIIDTIVYMTLLAFMIYERDDQQEHEVMTGEP